MPTLAIDTSTPVGRIAVAAGETVVFAAEFSSERSHNSQIFAPLGEALQACGGAPRRVAVGTGPGSSTGVRIGIAAAIGVAMAHGAPLAGFASLRFPAAARPGGAFTLVGDARRGALFVARVSGGALLEGPALHDLAALPELDGALFTYDTTPPLPAAHSTHPSAAKLAVHASCLGDDRFAELAATPPEPVYLRPPNITTPRKPGKAVPPA